MGAAASVHGGFQSRDLVLVRHAPSSSAKAEMGIRKDWSDPAFAQGRDAGFSRSGNCKGNCGRSATMPVRSHIVAEFSHSVNEQERSLAARERRNVRQVLENKSIYPPQHFFG